MSSEVAHIEKLIEEGTSRLLARAAESYSLAVAKVALRVKACLEKYLLKDNPGTATGSIVEFIDQLQADDLCLVIACEHGDAAAWNDLVARYSHTVRSAARSAAGNEDAAEDVAQSIWADLHGLRVKADGKAASKLAYYSGRGSLAGWLRAVVAQLAVDQHRKQSRFVQTEEDADFDRLGSLTADGKQPQVTTSTALNPEDALSHRLERVEMEKALGRSLKELPADDRLLVKLYYFDGLRLREAGAVLGVHEATASRRLTRIHAELRQRVEQILIRECGWTKREAEASFGKLGIHLEADLETLLVSKQSQAD